MEFQILFSNITNPVLLFFVLGIVATRLKSDLEIPANSSKFISLYLLFAIGFKGGQELAIAGSTVKYYIHSFLGWHWHRLFHFTHFLYSKGN
jgi:uncharacterized protein